MTYPNQPYPPQAPPQGYPPAAQPGYPPAQPQQAPQQYQGPAQPYQPPYPQQQGYAQPAPPQAPPPPVRTTAADFLDRPAMSGLSVQFSAPGDECTGTVARDLDDGDFPPQTESDGITPKRFRDKRIMTRMVVPLLVRPDQRHTDGRATLNVQGQMAEALKTAMSDVGAGHLHGIPEKGATIFVKWVSSIPPKQQGWSPTKIYQVVYGRPAGAAPGAQGNGQQAQEQPPWTPQAAPAQFTDTQVFPNEAQQWQPAPPPAPTQFDGAPLQAQPPWQGGYANPPGSGQPPQQAYQQQGPPAPQMPAQPQAPGMAGPAEQVAYATQAAQAAGQAAQQGPQGPPATVPPMPPYTAALMKQATGQQLTAEDQAALAAGPPQ